jgi:hypothetical protein
VEAVVPVRVINITAHPQPITVAEGSISESLSVTASVSPDATLTYQWYSNTSNNNTGGELITGATNASFAIPTTLTTAGSPYHYYCVVSAADAISVPSNAATVTVITGMQIIPVTNITDVITTAIVGVPLTLAGTVVPSNATHMTITWSVSNAGNTGATIESGMLHTTAEGTAIITATIADGAAVGIPYTQNFNFTVLRPEIETGVIPTYPGKPEVNDKTDINPDDLVEKDGKVYLTDGLAEKIAKDVLSVDKVNTHILPVFTVKVAPDGSVIGVTFTIKGKDLLAKYAHDINLIGLVSATTGELLKYVSSKAGDDGEFTLIFGGAVFEGIINDDDEYELWVYIKDGGKFDLDGISDGELIASMFLTSEDDGNEDKKGSSGGCNAYGYLAFALLGIVLVVTKVIIRMAKPQYIV